MSWLLAGVCFVLGTFGAAADLPRCDPSRGNGLVGYLTDQTGRPTGELLSLLREFGLKSAPTISSIAANTRREWFRPKGTERWQIQEKYELKKLSVVPYFEKVGMLCENPPSGRHYQHALLLGALLSRVRIRLAYLAKQWENGVRFDSIALLGCERRLDPKLESQQALLADNDFILPIRKDWRAPPTLPTNELEMMKFIFDQAALPAGMRAVKLVLVNSPNKRDFDGKETRAETEDTIITWLKTNPVSGKVLSISNQPFYRISTRESEKIPSQGVYSRNSGTGVSI